LVAEGEDAGFEEVEVEAMGDVYSIGWIIVSLERVEDGRVRATDLIRGVSLPRGAV
jgi:hypothetical protein